MGRRGVDTPLKREAFNESFANDFTASLNAVPAETHTIIISSEHFSEMLLFDDERERVKDLLAPIADRFQIICYLRDPREAVVPRYSTNIKSGTKIKFSKYCANFNRGLIQCNFRMLQGWERVFGRSSLTVRIYDRRHLKGGSIVTDFFEAANLNIDVTNWETVADRNPSLSKWGCEVLRAMNYIIPVRYWRGERGRQVRDRIVHWTTKYVPGNPQSLSPAQKGAFDDYFSMSNEQVRARYFPDQERLFYDK